MKRIISIILALALALSAAWAAALAEDGGAIVTGGAFPDFTAETTDGTFTLSDALQEKEAVLLIFWATYCEPCVREFPYIQKIYEELGDRLAVVALSIYPPDDMAAIEAFRGQYGLTFPMGRDEAGLFNRTGLNAIPTPVMIDRFGNVGYMIPGSLPSQAHAYRLVNAFLGDNYPRTLELDAIPYERTQAAYPTDEALSAALNAEGGALAFTGDPEGYDWPLLPETVDGRAAAVASNGAVNASSASAYFAVEAAEGDALAFDYKIDAAFCAQIEVVDNGAIVKRISGEGGWSTCALPLAAGTHEMRLRFLNDTDESWNPEGLDQYAAISGVRLLSGEEAEAALAAMPDYPVSDQSGFVPLYGGMRRVKGMLGDMDVVSELAELDVYLLNGPELNVGVRVGPGVDPDAAILLDGLADETYPLSSLYDGDAGIFRYAADLSDRADGAEALYLLTPEYQEEGYVQAVFYRSEADARSLLDSLGAQLGAELELVLEDVEGLEAALPGGEAAYVISVVDQAGEGVPDVTVNICTDEACRIETTDETGKIAFTDAVQDYHLQVLKVPEGYSFDAAKEMYTGEATEFTIEITKD